MILRSLYNIIKDENCFSGSFSSFKKVENLKITDVNLDSIDLKVLQELKYLKRISFINCELSDKINFSDMFQVKSIYLESCVFESVYFNNLFNIFSIEIKDCVLSSIPNIRFCRNLTKLYLNNINFGQYSSLSDVGIGDLFDANGDSFLKNLKKLTISNCKGIDILSLFNLSNLRDLDVSNSKINEIELGYIKAKKLETINASGNNLESFSYNFVSDLEYLNLENNPNLSDIKLSNQHKIKELLIDEFHKDLLNKMNISVSVNKKELKKIKRYLYVKNPIFFKDDITLLNNISNEIIDIKLKNKKDFVLDLIANNPSLSVKEAISHYRHFNNSL